MHNYRWVYHPEVSPQSEISLPKDKTHHLYTVLRLHENEKLFVFDGNGTLCIAILKKNSLICLDTYKVFSKDSQPLIIGHSIIKQQNMDFSIQKLTELGASEIQPLITEKTKYFSSKTNIEKKLTHWKKICINACEQSHNPFLPKIHPPLPYLTWLTTIKEKTRSLKIQLSLENEEMSIHEVNLNSIDKIISLIGPESGFTEEENLLAKKFNFLSVHLPFNILRTETAAITSTVLLQSKKLTTKNTAT